MSHVPNTAAAIAMQVVCTLLWGETGVGKTSAIRSLADKIKRTFLHMNCATHVAEDFGGYPAPCFDTNTVRQLPPSIFKLMENGDGMMLFDELTCAAPSTLAGALTILSDNMVGEYRLPETTLKVAAANPPELAPNSAPLPASIRSRFAHFDWEIDREALLAGYRNGCEWDAPDWPVVPVTWKDNLPYWGAIVGQYLAGNHGALCQMPTDDTVRSFPTPRGWEHVTRCLAASTACGIADKDSVNTTLVSACVGETQAAQFMAFLETMDLIDPASIVEGHSEYKFTSRCDLNICLVTGLIQQLRNHTSEERWLRVAETFAVLAENGEIETVLLGFKALWNDTNNKGVRPAGFMPPADLTSRLQDAVL